MQIRNLYYSEIIKFRDERDWEQFHNGKDLALALSIEAAELNQLFLWKNSEEVNTEKVEEEKPATTTPVVADGGISITTSDSAFTNSGSWKESTNASVAGPTGGTSWYTTDKKSTATFDASGLEKATMVYISI